MAGFFGGFRVGFAPGPAGIFTVFLFAVIGGFAFFAGVVDDADGPVDDSEGKGADDETDAGVEDGVSGFLEFAGVALRSHVIDTTDDDEDDGDDADNGDDGIKDNDDDIVYGIFVATILIATGGAFNVIG